MRNVWVVQENVSIKDSNHFGWKENTFSLATSRKEAIYLYMADIEHGWMHEKEMEDQFRQMINRREVRVVAYKTTLVKKKFMIERDTK